MRLWALMANQHLKMRTVWRRYRLSPLAVGSGLRGGRISFLKGKGVHSRLKGHTQSSGVVVSVSVGTLKSASGESLRENFNTEGDRLDSWTLVQA